MNETSFKSPEVTITINGAAFRVSTYRASFIAESLIEGGQEWEETAVDCARRNMKHPDAIGGYHGDFEAAVDAREMANTHAMLATALLHAADDGNSHYRCDVATCEKARERASRLKLPRKSARFSAQTLDLHRFPPIYVLQNVVTTSVANRRSRC